MLFTCNATLSFGVLLFVRNDERVLLMFPSPTQFPGGSWLTGSLYMNDFPTIKDLVHGNGANLGGWLLHLALATPDGADLFSTKNQHWYGSLLWSVIAKGNTGM